LHNLYNAFYLQAFVRKPTNAIVAAVIGGDMTVLTASTVEAAINTSTSPGTSVEGSTIHVPLKSPVDDSAWRCSVVIDVLQRLQQARLARGLCAQLRDKVANAHAVFTTSIHKLAAIHSNR
jgi:hypothetical protein